MSLHPTTIDELVTRVRFMTAYTDEEELSDTAIKSVIQDAQLRIKLELGCTKWFEEEAITLVLMAYTAMRLKAHVENTNIVEYQLGNQRVRVDSNASPRTAQQLQQWADDVRAGIQASDCASRSRPQVRSNGDYIGGQYIDDRGTTY